MCKWEMLAPPPAHACKRKWGKCDKCSRLRELSGHDRWYMIAAHFCLGSSAPGENVQPDTPDGTFSKSVRLIPFICRPKSPFKREMSEKGKRVQKLNWKARKPSITSHIKQTIFCTVSRSQLKALFTIGKQYFPQRSFLLVLKHENKIKKKQKRQDTDFFISSSQLPLLWFFRAAATLCTLYTTNLENIESDFYGCCIVSSLFIIITSLGCLLQLMFKHSNWTSESLLRNQATGP